MVRTGLLVLDVGGTSIKACIIDSNAQIIQKTIAVYDSKSRCSAEIIHDHFMNIINKQVLMAKDQNLLLIGIGMAFPGPFDYENGICLIKDLNKFDSIYNFNIRNYLVKKIIENENLTHHFTPDFKIIFKNDADSFAIGESHYGQAKQFQRAICLTIGTGIGSSFIENGKIVNNCVPLNGRIYFSNYQNGTAEDFISKRGILGMAKSFNIDISNLEVIDIANLAHQGELWANNLFTTFGENLGKILHPFIVSFKPNGITLGGQISKSAELFIQSLRNQLTNQEIVVNVTNNSLQSTFLGVYEQFKNNDS